MQLTKQQCEVLCEAMLFMADADPRLDEDVEFNKLFELVQEGETA